MNKFRTKELEATKNDVLMIAEKVSNLKSVFEEDEDNETNRWRYSLCNDILDIISQIDESIMDELKEE